MRRLRLPVCALALLASAALAAASTYRGIVTFAGLPLPGATITLAQGTRTLTAISDQSGAFAFNDLADGKWAITIAMQCFEPLRAEVTIAPKMPPAAWELKLLPQSLILAHAQTEMPAVELPPSNSAPPAPTPGKLLPQNSAQSAQPMPQAPRDENEESADGFLVQGSVNNAATSIFSTNPAFGNTRTGSRGLYTGGLAAFEESSALDARPYSLSGIRAPKPAFNNFTGVAVLQGPIRIPYLLPRGPNFFVAYQWTRNSSSQILTGLVPSQDERSGNLSGLTNALGQPVTVYNPSTGAPYRNNQLPVGPQAAALLKLYPLPNIANVAAYNYQAPVVNDSHQDATQLRLDKNVGRKDQLYGGLAFQSTRSDNVNLFGFIDQSGTLGINSNAHWTHRIRPGLFLFAGYTFARLRTEVTPNFARRENVSAEAGVTGNDQDPADFGPPALSFSSGYSSLDDANSAFNRNRSDDVTASALFYRGKHDIEFGGEFRKQEYNELFQENPRGTFTFTGAATAGSAASPANGSDLADFLLGIPDASSIAYGNADKYFRQPVYAAYFNDEWRLLPVLTINAGLRWDYGAPMTELFGRLVNLDVADGFSAVAPVVASHPVGPLTGKHYPSSLIRPDRAMFQPRIGISWRPIPASTVVIRAGYGIYPDTSVYQNLILQMAQQSPLSISRTAQNSPACPLTLAVGFAKCAAVTSETFGIDPNFRVGYAQEWQLQVQRDLPFALQMQATYLGTKGTHGPQQVLPNSYPLGETDPCPSCPSGFVYETSAGNSIRHAGQLQLRRRLRSGFAASLAYTYSKSIDDDAYLGGQGHTVARGGQTQTANLSLPSASIAQNWLDPRAERSLSSFDQRHLLNLQGQYTTGQGLEGGTLLGGWIGRMLKEWTILGTLSVASGFPETPLYPPAVPGTGFTNIIRPSLTGAPIYNGLSGAHLNAAAFSAPYPGRWGTAGRDSLTGPNQFSFNSSLARTFRPYGKAYLDFAIITTNTFNHATFSSWDNVVTSTQFGLPQSAGVMRTLEISAHLRFR